MSNNDKKENMEKTKEIFLDFTMSEEDNLDLLLSELIGGKKEEASPVVLVEAPQVVEQIPTPIEKEVLIEEPIKSENTSILSGGTVEIDLSEIKEEITQKPKVHFIDEAVILDSIATGEITIPEELKDAEPIMETASLFTGSLFSDISKPISEQPVVVEEPTEKLHQTGSFIFDGLGMEQLLTSFSAEDKPNPSLDDTILSKQAIQEIKEEFTPSVQSKEPETVLNEQAKSKIGDTIEMLLSDISTDNSFLPNDDVVAVMTPPTSEPVLNAAVEVPEEVKTLNPEVQSPVESEQIIEPVEMERSPKSSLDILLEKLSSISSNEPLPSVKEHSVAAEKIIEPETIIEPEVLQTLPEISMFENNDPIVDMTDQEEERVEEPIVEQVPLVALPKEERVVPKSTILFESLKTEPVARQVESNQPLVIEPEVIAEVPVETEVKAPEAPEKKIEEVLEQTAELNVLFNGVTIPEISYKDQQKTPQVEPVIEVKHVEEAPKPVLEVKPQEPFVKLEDSFDFENELFKKNEIQAEIPTKQVEPEVVTEQQVEPLIETIEKLPEQPVVEVPEKKDPIILNEHPDEEVTKEFMLKEIVKEPQKKPIEMIKKEEPMITQDEKTEEVESGAPILTANFLIRAGIGLAIYASLFFVTITATYIWGPIVRAIISLPFIISWIKQLGGTDQALLQAYQSIFIENILYFILFIIIVPLFWKELKESARKLKENLLYLLILPAAYIVGIVLTSGLQLIALLFVENLPASSQNQNLIESSISVSKVGNIFPTIIGAPFVEELIFRTVIAGVIYGLVLLIMGVRTEVPAKDSRKKTIAAVMSIIVSALLFGLLHVSSAGDYLAILPYIAMGITFTSVYFVTKRNVMVTILLHMLINLVAFIQIIL